MTDAASPYHFLERDAGVTRGNVTVHVTNALRRAIVTMAFAPGEVLDKGAICAQLGVSRFPVSEALARLAGEGLVDILPQRGSVVSRIRIGDVSQYMLIRKALEGEAMRAAAIAPPPDLFAEIAANLAGQKAAADAGDRETFHLFDLEFHDILFEALGFDKVRPIIESARANLDRARRMILTPRRLAVTFAEHEAIVAALRQGDGEQAAAAMRRHLDGVMVELLAFARDNPDLFADGGQAARETTMFTLG